jgi:hypothetical protein
MATTHSDIPVVTIEISSLKESEYFRKATVELSDAQYCELKSNSSIFADLDKVVKPIETHQPICLCEKNPFSAVQFLQTLVETEKKNFNIDDLKYCWNREYVELSVRWNVKSYIDIYGQLSQEFLLLLKSKKQLFISCPQMPKINGIYQKSPNENVYSKLYHPSTYIFGRKWKDSYCWCLVHGNSYYNSSITSLQPPNDEDWYSPHLGYHIKLCIKFLGLTMKDILNDTMLPTILCDIFELYFNFQCYSRWPLRNKDDLIDILRNNKNLRSKDVLDRLMSKEDIINLLLKCDE